MEELIGTTIKNISVENNIVDIEKEAKRSFGFKDENLLADEICVSDTKCKWRYSRWFMH